MGQPDPAMATLVASAKQLAGLRPHTYADQRKGWAYPNFAALVLAHGRVFVPAPLPAMIDRRRPGHCFRSASDVADRSALTYVEGLALFSGHPFAADHAWCVDAEGSTVDPSPPDGPALAYLGLPLVDEFRRGEQRRRVTHAVITVDTGGLVDNTLVLRDGLPPDALTDLGSSLTI
jgi:hypothetical protein